MKSIVVVLAWVGSTTLLANGDKIAEGLNMNVPRIDFPNSTSLDEVIAFFADFTGLSFDVTPQVRTKHAEGLTVGPLKLKDVRVKSVLKIILHPRGLSLIDRNGVLVIVPSEEIERDTFPRVYDVHDLTHPIKEFPGPKVTLTSTDPCSDPLVSADFLLEEEETDEMTEDFIVNLIQTSVTPEAWDRTAHIKNVNGRLVVTHNRPAHEEVRALLQQLRLYK